MNFKLSQENVGFQKSNNSLSNDLKSFQEKFVLIEKEKDELQMKCVNLETIVLKFSKVEKNLNKIVDPQKMTFKKERIGFNPFNKNKCYKNLFVKLTNYKSESSITYNYYSKI